MSSKVTLEQQEDYQFLIRFGEGRAPLLGDESPPIGKGAGPTPVQLLAAAAANCLADSLVFALRKFKQSPEPVRAEAEAETGRNAEGRLRVQRIAVRLTLGVPGARLAHLDRALAQFERFCTVAESIGAGIPVEVEVYDSAGARLKGAPEPGRLPASPTGV